MAAPNPQIPIEARQTVLDMIVANQSFTAYEITLEVRRRLGTGVEVPHPIVNPIVQTMFSGGEIIGYTRAPDATVNAANPPFRYSPQGTPVPAPPQVAAPPVQLSPAILRANRMNRMPEALRFNDPVRAIMREYGLEARDFHIAAGKPDLPFDVFLPTNAQLFWSVRSLGAGLSEAEVVARYSLSPATRFDGTPISQAAFAYADEFEITSFVNGVETVYRAALDAALVGTVVKQSEQPTTRADGLKIKIALPSSRDMSLFQGGASAYDRFRVKPKIPKWTWTSPPHGSQIVAQGTNWDVTSMWSHLSEESAVVVDEVAYPIENFLIQDCGLAQLTYGRKEEIELHLPTGAVDVTPNRDNLVFSDRTKAALKEAFERMVEEFKAGVEQQFVSARNIWEAKQVYRQVFRYANTSHRLRSLLASTIGWQGILLGNESFEVPAFPDGIVSWSRRDTHRGSSRIRTSNYGRLEALPGTVVVFNDLSTRTGSPSRVKRFFEDNPDVQNVYVLTFSSDAVRDKFISDNHFESVPVRLLSTLVKPASTVRVSAKTPFDPAKHFEQRPDNALVAAYFDGNANFDALEQWARSVALDKTGWPDFKRFYKHIEARVWPIPTRSRWKKNEANLPSSSPWPGERELIALGLLIGRLAETDERDQRNRRQNFASTGGPTRATLAYMLRRVGRLVEFLRDTTDLSAARRAWIAPLTVGMLQRPHGLVFATRQKLVDGEELGARPDLIDGLWHDTTLPLVILKWAHDWLQARGLEVRTTSAHIRVLLNDSDGLELALRLLSPLLKSHAAWPADYSLDDLSRAIESASAGAPVLPRVLSLFARFPQLHASDGWLRTALGEVTESEPEVFDWAARWVQNRAREGDFALLPRLSALLQSVFNAELVAAFSNGLNVTQWQTLVGLQADEGLALAPALLAPALTLLPLSPEVAVFLWSLPEQSRAGWIDALGQTKFNEAFAATIEVQAARRDFGFALSLSASQRDIFFDVLARDQNGLDSVQWQGLDALDDSLEALSAGLARLPLGEGFWKFFLILPAEERALWLERVGVGRATRSFTERPASEVAMLLDGDTQGIEPLLDAWIEANLSHLTDGEELVVKLATSDNTVWQEAALAHLSRHPLSIPVALRLFESGLPRAQTLAQGFFTEDASDWSERVLALCDSPLRAAQREALELLARFPTRWTPDLLTQLAQHDDPLVQSFVAARLSEAPQNGSVVAFENAILNARGRSRHAKNQVQRQLNEAPQLDAALLESLLDAARNGAPRDRAWALGQLVRFKMAGTDVGELQLSGAVARARVPRSQE